jgi:hypothetical protein
MLDIFNEEQCLVPVSLCIALSALSRPIPERMKLALAQIITDRCAISSLKELACCSQSSSLNQPIGWMVGFEEITGV